MKNSLKTEQWATWICLGAGGILCIGLLVEFALGLAPCPLHDAAHLVCLDRHRRLDWPVS